MKGVCGGLGKGPRAKEQGKKAEVRDKGER